MHWRGLPFLIAALLLLGLVGKWSYELMRLGQLRRDGRTALATIDEASDHDLHGPSRSPRWITYYFRPSDSESQFQGHDWIDSGALASITQAATPAAAPRPLNVKYLPNDPGFSRVADTTIDRVVSIRVAIVLTGTVAALLVGWGLLLATNNREALATLWRAPAIGS